MNRPLLLEYKIEFMTAVELDPNTGRIDDHRYEQIPIPAKHNEQLDEIGYEFMLCNSRVCIMHDLNTIIQFDVLVQLPADRMILPSVRTVLLVYEHARPFWKTPVGFRAVRDRNGEFGWKRTF